MSGRTTYGIAWRVGDGPTAVGRLRLAEERVELRNGTASASVPYAEIAHVRIGRGGGDRVNGIRSVVLERGEEPAVYVAPIDGIGRATELADALGARTRAPHH